MIELKDIEKYLRRLNYTGSLDPTLQVLRELQQSHLLSIPFENLDIHYGVPIDLDIDKLFEKIVLARRGGFCYELNGLFYELLITLGFNASRISARVFDKINGYGPEYDHLAILVEIDGIKYLSDVGFGEFTFAPLKLDTTDLQHDPRGNYVIEPEESGYFRVSKSESNILIPQYIFQTMARELNAFDEMCHYHQTNPASHFTQKRLMTIPTHEGRITITQDTLKIKHADAITETHIENEEAFRNILRTYFGIAQLYPNR